MPWKSVICNGLSFSSFHLFSISSIHLFSISILLPFCCCFKMIQITWFGSLGWSALCLVPSTFLYFIPSVTARLKKNEKAGWETLVKEDESERVGRSRPNGNEEKKVPGWRWWLRLTCYGIFSSFIWQSVCNGCAVCLLCVDSLKRTNSNESFFRESFYTGCTVYFWFTKKNRLIRVILSDSIEQWSRCFHCSW